MRQTTLGAMAMMTSLLCTVGISSGQVHTYRPEVGKPHVDFVLPRIDNREPVSLSDFRGQKVLLVQFASW